MGSDFGSDSSSPEHEPIKQSKMKKDLSVGFNANTDRKERWGYKRLARWTGRIFGFPNNKRSLDNVSPTPREVSTKGSLEVQSTTRCDTENVPIRNTRRRKRRKSSSVQVVPAPDPSEGPTTTETFTSGSIKVSTTGHNVENISIRKWGSRKWRKSSSVQVVPTPDPSWRTSEEALARGSLEVQSTSGQGAENLPVQKLGITNWRKSSSEVVPTLDPSMSPTTKETLTRGSLEVPSTTGHSAENIPIWKSGSREWRKSSSVQVILIPDPLASPTTKEDSLEVQGTTGHSAENVPVWKTGSRKWHKSSSVHVVPTPAPSAHPTAKVDESVTENECVEGLGVNEDSFQSPVTDFWAVNLHVALFSAVFWALCRFTYGPFGLWQIVMDFLHSTIAVVVMIRLLKKSERL